MGPMPPRMTDQKSAGRSRAAQRQYLKGVDQKCGAADMVAYCGKNKVLAFMGVAGDGGSGVHVLNCGY